MESAEAVGPRESEGGLGREACARREHRETGVLAGLTLSEGRSAAPEVVAEGLFILAEPKERGAAEEVESSGDRAGAQAHGLGLMAKVVLRRWTGQTKW